MEEARQHSTLTPEQIAVTVVYFLGLLAIMLGIILQFTIGGESLLVGLLFFAVTKVMICLWQLVRPASVPWRERSRVITALVMLVWLAGGVILSMPLWMEAP